MHAPATKASPVSGPGTVSRAGTVGSRLLSVQALRAVGALLVVWVHSINAAEHFTTPAQARFFHWDGFGASGVDIFFAISGFIVSLVAVRSVAPYLSGPHRAGTGTTSAARGFLTRRITRIFPLYWILTGVIILEGELGRYPIHWHSVQWLPTILLFPSLHHPQNAPLLSLGWSLMFEMYFYGVLAIFMVCTPRSLVRNTIALLCAMAVVGIGVGIHRPLLVLWMNPMVLEFVFGCLIGLLYVRLGSGAAGWGRAGAGVAMLGAVLLAATIFTGYGRVNNQDWIMSGYFGWLRVGVWGIPAALLVGGTIFWNPAMRSLPARVLVFLGDASYSIYLCTLPARSVVEHFWNVFGRFGGDMGVLLGAVFCTAVGVVCYLLVERPMMRAFHNWYKPIPFRSTAA